MMHVKNSFKSIFSLLIVAIFLWLFSAENLFIPFHESIDTVSFASSDEGSSNEGSSNEGSSNEGSSNEDFSDESSSGEGSSAEEDEFDDNWGNMEDIPGNVDDLQENFPEVEAYDLTVIDSTSDGSMIEISDPTDHPEFDEFQESVIETNSEGGTPKYYMIAADSISNVTEPSSPPPSSDSDPSLPPSINSSLSGPSTGPGPAPPSSSPSSPPSSEDPIPVALFPQSVRLSEGHSTVRVRNWKLQSYAVSGGFNLSMNINGSNPSITNIAVSGNDLVFEVSPNATPGTYTYEANIGGFISAPFNIKILSTPPTFNYMDSNVGLNNIKNIAENYQSASSVSIETRNEAIRKISKLNETISTINVPTYSFNDFTEAIIDDGMISMIENKITEINNNTKIANDYFSLMDPGHQLNTVLVFRSLNLWNEELNLVTIPYDLQRKLFDNNIDSVILKNEDVSFAFLENTFLSDAEDMIKTFHPNLITFQSKKLDDTKFELKTFLDNYSVSQFKRHLSVRFNYAHSNPSTQSLLTVMYDNPSGPNENMGGTYDPIQNWMVFETNHFSIFFIHNPNIQFNDINPSGNHWSSKLILSLASKGVVSGNPSGNFLPNNPISRRDAAIMIANAFKFIDTSASSSFSDVSTSDFGYPHISSMYEAGIIKGYGGRYYPDNFIKKQDAAILISNSIQYRNPSFISIPENPDSYLAIYSDMNQIDFYAKRHFAFMTRLQLIKGSNGLSGAQNNLTRAEMAAILYQALNLKDFQGLPLDPPKVVKSS